MSTTCLARYTLKVPSVSIVLIRSRVILRVDKGPTSVELVTELADAASAVAGFDWLVLDSRGASDTGDASAHSVALGDGAPAVVGSYSLVFELRWLSLTFPFPLVVPYWRRARLARQPRSSRPQSRPSFRPSQLSSQFPEPPHWGNW